MTSLRALCAIILFLVALFQFLELWFTGFTFLRLALAAVFFLVAYWFWPSKRENPRHRYQDDRWFDWLEFLIELPVEMFLWLVRSLFGLLRRGVDDIDISP